MTRTLKLRIVPPAMENGAGEPMTRKDPFDDVLAAFAVDSAPEELSPEELDKLYSAALSEGLLSEADVDSSFERFLSRRVEPDSKTGELALAAEESPTLGSVVRLYREQRSLSVEQLAREHQMKPRDLNLLETSVEPYEPSRLEEIAKAVGTNVGLPVARVHTLLQSIRATLELKAAHGPMLMAARKVPPK